MMGEMTFNQIYGGNDTTCDVNLGPHAASLEDTGGLMLEEVTGNLEGELQEGDGSMAALHESIQETLRSAPSTEVDEGAQGGSPTGFTKPFLPESTSCLAALFGPPFPLTSLIAPLVSPARCPS
jgi:hypothetical protein